MPGYNHFPSCSCGWCIGGGSNGNRLQSINLSKSTNSLSTGLSVAQITGSKTYQTECWWCGELVYYHTNGYGDHVLFDSLGYPWQIHKCWREYWQGQKEKNVRNFKIQSHILFKKENKGITAFEDFNYIQQKHLILAGIINQINIKYELATEENVASKMGITIALFRQEYKHHYNLYRENGITQIRLEHTPIYPVSIPNHSNERKKKQTTVCPHCKSTVSVKNLEKHIKKVHKLNV
ncbi:hypothetical protein [Anabaena lutea]|uniref:C2H2-type domain-containing protein n=1 Tax=Anabaena lutea FACHB-196 TaxID=2692881 RepID=A0ABR8FFV4_9NOST|nr:hypothetical protein [Anabaena lutea]MBD2568649.1 hypothetical protein [Anabaena lutea FACHB-196]